MAAWRSTPQPVSTKSRRAGVRIVLHVRTPYRLYGPHKARKGPVNRRQGPRQASQQGRQRMREIDQLRSVLEKTLPPKGVLTPWEARRARMDAFGAACPLAEAWSVAQDALGRPAERHLGPGARTDVAVLYLHGGGYCLGSAQSHRGLVSHLAAAASAQAYALDYRLAPEHPAPAAIEDVLLALKALEARGAPPAKVILAGDSAGGGLALATTLRLRDAGQSMPCALLLLSPWADLTFSGRSHTTRAQADPILTTQDLEAFAEAYVGSKSDRAGPDASPLFADLTGLPPMLIQVGADEILLSDSEVLQARAVEAGVMAALEVWPSMIHVWHIYYATLAQGRIAIADAGGWMARRLA